MQSETPKPPLKQLADIMSEHRALTTMEAEYGDDPDGYAALDHELAERALALLDTADLSDVSSPLIADALRYTQHYKALRTSDRARYPTDKQRNLVDPEAYKEGALYQTLSDESKERIDTLMLNLLDGETLNDIGTAVGSAQEAAEALGLQEHDVERAYGLLSDIEEVLDEGDTLEFFAIRLEQPESIPRIETTGENESGIGGGGSYELSDRYIARVRKNQSEQVISLVMDAVPIAENNAAYVLRNDDGLIANIEAATSSKKTMRAHGARRVAHNQVTGEAGVLKRINALLAVNLETFRNPSYRPDKA